MGVWRRTGGSLLAAAMALTLSGCAEMFPEKYRLRLTVEVDTPQGLRKGSSVYEVWANNKTALLPDEVKRDWGVRGEAVAVDLPNGQTLFALLKTNAKHGDMAGLSMTALDPAFRNDIVESAARIASGDGFKRQANVAPDNYPMLVYFRDLADPASVQVVNPADFASPFGPGYALRIITVQITDEAVTTIIEKKLTWLSSHRNKTFAGNRYPREKSLADSLAAGSFSTEIVE